MTVLALLIGGIFVYNQKTKEAYGERFNVMNEAYKKVLFATGTKLNQRKQKIYK